jgi:hypothetical protein
MFCERKSCEDGFVDRLWLRNAAPKYGGRSNKFGDGPQFFVPQFSLKINNNIDSPKKRFFQVLMSTTSANASM